MPTNAADFILGEALTHMVSSELNYELANSTIRSKTAFPRGSLHDGLAVVHVGIEGDSPRAGRAWSGNFLRNRERSILLWRVGAVVRARRGPARVSCPGN